MLSHKCEISFYYLDFCISCYEYFASISIVYGVLCSVQVKMPPKRRQSAANKIQSPRISRDETSQSSQNSKFRAKNYSADECQALIKCCDKFHPIITKNSSRDKDKQEKQQAWETIKSDYDHYCKSQGIYVSIECHLFNFKK